MVGITWESEDNFGESVPAFYQVVLGDQTQVINPSSKHLYLLSHLVTPDIYYKHQNFFKINKNNRENIYSVLLILFLKMFYNHSNHITA